MHRNWREGSLEQKNRKALAVDRMGEYTAYLSVDLECVLTILQANITAGQTLEPTQD